MTGSSSEETPGGRRRIKVSIVDDSVIVRGLFSRWLAEETDIEIVGIHRNGLEALRGVAHARPDVILLDIEMPEMDGLTALPLLLQKVPEARVLVVSSLSLRGADITLKCLMRGAADYLTKPSAMGSGETPAEFRLSLLARIRALGRGGQGGKGPDDAARPGGFSEATPSDALQAGWTHKTLTPDVAARLKRAMHTRPALLVIGASTGGPQAIAAMLAGLGATIDLVPIVIAQHMPALFTQMFAAHLGRQLAIETVELDTGTVLRAGVVHICRGGQKTELTRNGAGLSAVVHPGTGGTRSLPSINALFASAAREVGAGVVAVALTGLGDDGAEGASAVKAARGVVLTQNEASSVVWGIPAAVVKAGAETLVEDVAGLSAAIRLLLGRA